MEEDANENSGTASRFCKQKGYQSRQSSIVISDALFNMTIVLEGRLEGS
jgi:hypothetical protein